MRLILALLCVPLVAYADLAKARAEPKLEKRARMALDNAEDVLKSARQSYGEGDFDKARGLLQEVAESVDLAFASLKQTGKDPVRSPKPFKQAELKTRGLLRRLAAFSDEMDLGDRPAVEKVRGAVQKIHDAVLNGIMEGWK